MVHTWALKGLPCHSFGVFLYTIQLRGAFGGTFKDVENWVLFAVLVYASYVELRGMSLNHTARTQTFQEISIKECLCNMVAIPLFVDGHSDLFQCLRQIWGWNRGRDESTFWETLQLFAMPPTVNGRQRRGCRARGRQAGLVKGTLWGTHGREPYDFGTWGAVGRLRESPKSSDFWVPLVRGSLQDSNLEWRAPCLEGFLWALPWLGCWDVE